MPVAWAFPTLWYLVCGWRNGSNEYSFPIPLYKFSVRKILFSLISCFAYTIQLRKNIKLIVGQRKSHLQRMEAKVYTGRDMMTLCKNDSCDFRKLEQRELWSYQMLILQYIIHNSQCLDPSVIYLSRNYGKKGTGTGHILAN